MCIKLVPRCCFNLMSDATDCSGVNTVTIIVLVFCFLFWAGILNRLLQIGSLKKGFYTWHSVLAHCFPDDMNYVLSFGCLFPFVTGAFHFLCVNAHVFSVCISLALQFV